MDAKDIDQEKKEGLYVVEFETGKTDDDHKILFDTLGSVLKYKYEISKNQLPAPVVGMIQATYKDYKIDEAENLEISGATYYQVELEKGQLKKYVIFSADGILNNNMSYWR